MALVVKDRVKETTATTGTGTLTLAGALTGFQSFSSALSDGDTTYYAIFESSTGEWEVGLGTFTSSGTTLARTTVLASSNSGSAVNLTAGSAEVFITEPAGKSAYFDASGDLVLNQDPTSALQAATKQYVDTIAAAGLHYHAPVRVQTTANLSATYNNGSSGVGATLTNSGTQAAISIDNVTLSSADRVLVSEQTNAAHNGVYTVTNVGSASTNWVLTRATDADSYGPSDPDALGEGDAFFVKEGDTNAGHLDVMTTSGTITFGTTNIVFSEVAETTVYSAGNGLTLTGTTFAVGAGTGVTVNANDIAIGQSVGTGDTVTFATVNANLTGNVTGNLTGNVTGNADTATAWATGRSLTLSGDVTGTATGIDGSGNIAVTTTIAADSVALGTDTTGNYVSTGAVSGNGLSGSASAEGATFTVTSNATNLNTASTIVFRDASGNFSAGTITAALTGNVNGNATTASAWQTGRTLSLTGDVTGSTTIDGSGNASISTTIGANSVALGTDTTGNYVQQGATSGNGISGSVNSEGGTFTVTSNATNANTANTIVFRDASGNFSAGTITAALSGNATTATNVSGYSGTYWTSNNDGAGSGLDADLWDGNQFSSYLNQAVLTTSDVTFNEVYNNNWFRNNQSGEGLYNQATTQHWYSDDDDWWNVAGGTAANGIRFRDDHNGTIRGAVYANNANEVGFLDSDQQWAYRHVRDSRHEWLINNIEYMQLDSGGLFLHDGSLAEDYDALSGTTPTCNVNNGGAFSLTMTGNTTFTFSGAASGYSQGFVLQLTGNGSTVTWPTSVKWAGGTAPDAPGSGETDILVFWTRDGGTNWYGVLSSDAAS